VRVLGCRRAVSRRLRDVWQRFFSEFLMLACPERSKRASLASRCRLDILRDHGLGGVSCRLATSSRVQHSAQRPERRGRYFGRVSPLQIGQVTISTSAMGIRRARFGSARSAPAVSNPPTWFRRHRRETLLSVQGGLEGARSRAERSVLLLVACGDSQAILPKM